MICPDFWHVVSQKCWPKLSLSTDEPGRHPLNQWFYVKRHRDEEKTTRGSKIQAGLFEIRKKRSKPRTSRPKVATNVQLKNVTHYVRLKIRYVSASFGFISFYHLLKISVVIICIDHWKIQSKWKIYRIRTLDTTLLQK